MTAAPWLIVRSLRLSTDRMKHWLDGLHRLGFETYYPMMRECRPVPRRKLSHAQRSSSASIMRPAVVPFLPQLVFARGGDFWSLADHPGTVGFVVGTCGEPAHVADGVVERLRAREKAGGGAIPGGTPVEYIFTRGERVQVVNGAFANQTGIVEVAPDVPIERIDADTRLRLTIGGFKIQVAVCDVRKA